MGYYSPTYANLSSGWYWSTTNATYANERDICLSVWDSRCDGIVKKYFHEYGMFLMAFENHIKKEIRELIDSRFPFPQYFSYFFVSKILSDSALAKIFLDDYNSRSQLIIECCNCNKIQIYDDIHPSLIGRTMSVFPLCNSCGFWLSEFTDLTTIKEIPADFRNWFIDLKKEQECVICSNRYTWLKESVRYTYEILFIPGKHLQICPKCVHKAILGSNLQDDLLTNLKRFKSIADAIGSIPEKSGFIYNQIDSLEMAINLTKEMHKMPSFSDLSKSCGSWFKLLIASSILPEGARKMIFGTMVLAKDGHECLSLAEKEIDDLLFANGIPHEREPHYPDSNFRADWLLKLNGKNILVEFFGLYGEPNYTKRMKEKLEFASSKGIQVVSFLPKDLNNLHESFSTKILSLFYK